MEDFLEKNGLNPTIVQHNLISRGSFDWNELKLDMYYTLLGKIRKGDTANTLYEVRLEELRALSGKKCDYSLVKKVVTDLMNDSVVKVEKLVDGQREFENITLIGYAKYREGESSFYVQIHPASEHLLFGLERNFTKMKLVSAVGVRKKFSKRIYPILCSHSGQKSFIEEFDDLRERIGALSYKTFTKFKERVLVPAQEELNEKAEISFDFKPLKTGRRIDRIEFIIKHLKKQDEVVKTSKVIEPKAVENAPVVSTLKDIKHPEQDPTLPCVVERMRKRGLTDKEIMLVCRMMSFEDVKKALHTITWGLKEANHPAGYVRSHFPCLKR